VWAIILRHLKVYRFIRALWNRWAPLSSRQKTAKTIGFCRRMKETFSRKLPKVVTVSIAVVFTRLQVFTRTWAQSKNRTIFSPIFQVFVRQRALIRCRPKFGDTIRLPSAVFYPVATVQLILRKIQQNIAAQILKKRPSRKLTLQGSTWKTSTSASCCPTLGAPTKKRFNSGTKSEFLAPGLVLIFAIGS
jgi:hypothetical protein